LLLPCVSNPSGAFSVRTLYTEFSTGPTEDAEWPDHQLVCIYEG